LLEY
jgi:hypothetical protein